MFVADLFAMPLADSSIDVVYSCHSLEPNGGREEEAMRECLRVARKAVVLVEPIYELASPDAKKRMQQHGYVRGLRAAADKLGASILDYRLLRETGNPLNPSGVLVLAKREGPICTEVHWRCPVTAEPLECMSDVFFAPSVGLAYPILREIPMLRAEHAIVASKLSGAA